MRWAGEPLKPESRVSVGAKIGTVLAVWGNISAQIKWDESGAITWEYLKDLVSRNERGEVR